VHSESNVAVNVGHGDSSGNQEVGISTTGSQNPRSSGGQQTKKTQCV
jgi:hypothetical protein